MDDSRWLNRAVDEMNNRDDDNNNNTPNNNRVDLTLKLGLSAFDFNQNTTLYQNTQQGVVNQGAVNQGATVEGQESFNGSQTPFAWPTDQMESGLHNMNDANAFSPFAGSSLGFPSYGTTNFAPTRPLLPSPPPSPQAPATGYMLLDVPPRRAAATRQLELESSSGRRVGIYNDPNRRCTNYNCKTNDTPMWRKGPLGPKTLCNACGIKYRKEQEKKAKEARGRGRGRRSNPNGN